MKIESYSFGQMKIDGNTYTSDLILYPEKIDSSWWRKEGHRLHMDDLTEILKKNPDTLIIGTGYYGVMKIPEDLKQELLNRNINLFIEKTEKAIDIYNRMKGEETVIGAFHLTC